MRKGQIISNFINWLKQEKGIDDIFYLTDKDWNLYMNEYKKLLNHKNLRKVNK